MKNRKKSPVTGLRKLSTDPGVALTIRKVLAKELQAATADTGDEDAFLLIGVPPAPSYIYAGAEARVTPVEIETFGYELVRKEIIHAIDQSPGGGFKFFPTKQGWIAIRKGDSRLFEAPKAVFTTDFSNRQKPSVYDKMVASRLKDTRTLDQAALHIDSLPTAQELLVPLLRVAAGEPVPIGAIVKKIAEQVGFSKERIHFALPADTNQTFAYKARYAIEYLVNAGFLHRTKKTLSLTSLGRQVLSSPGYRWSNFEEPAVEKVTDGRPQGPQIDITRVLLSIQSMEPVHLIAMWENAHRILNDPRRHDQHEKVGTAIRGIEAEWKRRNSSGDPNEYFDWPTTVVRGGDGSLSLENIQKSGVLAKLDYHVGRTLGQSDAYRRRTLMKIFEQPLSKDFAPEDWGSPGSANRLRKMAYSIAAFTRSAKRKRMSSLDEAIRHWEADLKFLHDHYYAGKFRFAWPSTQITETTI